MLHLPCFLKVFWRSREFWNFGKNVDFFAKKWPIMTRNGKKKLLWACFCCCCCCCCSWIQLFLLKIGLENAPKVAKSLHLRPDKDETSGKCCQNAAFNCYNHAKASLRLKKAILTRKATGKTMTKNSYIFILKWFYTI